MLHRENVARGDKLRVFKLYRGGEGEGVHDVY